MLKGRKIIVGISGGIAAYKVPLLVRLLVKAGAEVRCAATPHALQFVTPLTLETLSQAPVYSDLFAEQDGPRTTHHISLKDWGDMMIVAPATANIIGKAACGIADDALSTLIMAFRKPLLMCPAMNTEMLQSPALQHNLEVLKAYGTYVMPPASGELACGATGDGRMPEPDEIVRYAESLLASTTGTCNSKRVLITAGPTYERIDPVRFIGNFSTGKMGLALAQAFANRGVEVELICGPMHLDASHPLIHRTDVESAREMCDAATRLFPSCNGAILAAAVADYRPASQSQTKLKKNGNEGLTLQLTQNPDILATLSAMRQEGQIVAGFALETNNAVENATAKLQRKKIDFIVLNSLEDSGAGIGTDTNKVTIIDSDGTTATGSLKSKAQVAADIAEHMLALLK